MTSTTEPNNLATSSVQYLGRLRFNPDKQDTRRFSTLFHEQETGRLQVLVYFDVKTYPLERHFVFAEHRGQGLPYTFSNMDFHPDPPGVRVGPWPGWRGIPSFPQVTVTSGKESVTVTMMPWGDELNTHMIRGGATFEQSSSGEILCEVADDRLRPEFVDLYTCRPMRAIPAPVMLLPELAGTHPRLLVTPSKLAGLKDQAGGSHQKHWARIVDLLENSRLPWEITPESKTLPGPERLRSDDRALMSAFVAMVEPSPIHCSLAKAGLTEYCNETRERGYQPLTIDTQAGETLFILSLCYDWTYTLWSDVERKELQSWIWQVADICWAHLGYERKDFGQAHYLGCALGLLAFSFLFWDEHPRSREWAGHFRGVLERVVEMLPPDGFFPHGINLWIYEYGFLLRWLELFRVASGEDVWPSTQHWANASRFRGAATTPEGGYGITFGDPQYRVGGDSWCHYLIASRTGSGGAQFLGNLLQEVSHEGVDFRSVSPRRRVYEFLFFNPEIQPEPHTAPVQLFSDGGQVFIRSSGDRPSLFTFRAGPPLGRQRYAAGESGAYGHADPCNGSFLLSLGNVPAISGPGPTYRRDTSLHNTITIDGQGQVGDSTVWLPDFFPPKILCPPAQTQEHNGRISISAPLTPIYLPHLEVEECHRALWIDPGKCIIGVDTVRCRGLHSLEWNIHSPAIVKSISNSGPLTFDLADRHILCRLTIYDSTNLVPKINVAGVVPAYPNDGARFFSLQLSTRAKETRFAWCLMLDPDLPRPTYLAENRQVRFQFGKGTWVGFNDTFLIEYP